jgi:hypothetical protein
MKKLFPLVFLATVVIVAVSCNPELLEPDPDALPSFSTDTVSFDTVFTTIGSATLSIKVYNRSSRPLLMQSVSLAGGESSFFRLNIDGLAGTSEQNVEIPPDDSLYIFIAVTIDPTNINNPVVVTDSILFNTNGKLKNVTLIAYGQDVHLLNNDVITSQTWTNDKPYLIYNSMAVDTAAVLTIEAGTRIYFHRNSSMVVWGTLIVNGTPEAPVVFRNDRLESYYDVIAGQWGTIYLDAISNGNKINHAIIKNSVAGIQIGYPSDYTMPDLELSNSIIQNTSFAGIYAFGANITCYNTVIANSAGAAAALFRGGNYRFLHCSVSNNGIIGSNRIYPSVVLTNTFNSPEFDELSGQYVYVVRTGDLTEAEFANCIINGNLNHELMFVNNGSDLFNYRFNHCLVKALEDSVDLNDNTHYISIILNEDPAFMNDSDRYHLNFALDTLSPAKDTGDASIISLFPFLNDDISGNSRMADGKPDLGAFERKED